MMHFTRPCFVVFPCIFALCGSLTFNIDRKERDNIPNNLEVSADGTWRTISCRNSCTKFNTGNVGAGQCRCDCKYSHSTFRMGATANQSLCVDNRILRSDAGCSVYFENNGDPSSSVPVLSSSTPLRIKNPDNGGFKCSVNGKNAQYLDKGKWIDVTERDLFIIDKQKLKWSKSGVYSGRIMRQYMTCRFGRSLCIIFKAEGTLRYDISLPTTNVPASSTLQSTTARPSSVSTARSTRPTTKQTFASTARSIIPTTTTTQTAPSTQTTSLKSTTTTLIPTTKHSTHDTLTTEQQITTSKANTDQTKTSTTPTGANSGHGGALGGDPEGTDDTITIAAIGAVAAIVCVVVVCIFIWCMMKRKHNHRDNAYCSDMTVITNATAMNNNPPAPTLNNPIYENPEYSEPTRQQHHITKPKLPKLGNPVYDYASQPSVKGKASSIAQHNRNDLHKKHNNHHDNRDIINDGAYDNAAYQEIKPANQSAHTDNHDIRDYKPVYEELPGKPAMDSVYQPLVRNSQIQDENKELPEYLAILNEERSNQDNQMTPEYLTLLNDERTPNQPGQSCDYDYAIPEKRKVATNKGLNSKGAVMLLKDPYNEGSTVYQTLEDPNNEEHRDMKHDSGCNDYLQPVEVIQKAAKQKRH